VVLELETPWRDGTTHIVMSPIQFMPRRATLVAPLLAPVTAWRLADLSGECRRWVVVHRPWS
jgi:hypothetical protein